MKKLYLALILAIIFPAIVFAAGVNGVENPAAVNGVALPDEVTGVSGLAAGGDNCAGGEKFGTESTAGSNALFGSGDAFVQGRYEATCTGTIATIHGYAAASTGGACLLQIYLDGDDTVIPDASDTLIDSASISAPGSPPEWVSAAAAIGYTLTKGDKFYIVVNGPDGGSYRFANGDKDTEYEHFEASCEDRKSVV